uniref:GNAT family N-acetyltransferase n=1 Tax=Stappia sp. TaxID=1870903 RepID=UPI003BABAD9F
MTRDGSSIAPETEGPAGSVDVLVVGGGAAGLLLALRLSEDADRRVVVLEAGRRRRSPLLSIPAGETLLLGNPDYDWRFATEPDATLDGRSLSIPRGRLVGGSAAINGMIFVRGQRDDFDRWAAMGCEGWSWEDVLPYFRALEDWQGAADGDGAQATRGAGGPIRVELPRDREPLAGVFLEAARQAGYPLDPDYNSGTPDGFALSQVSARAGRRSSVAGETLRRLRARENVEIVEGATATGLVLRGRRCLGVSWRRDGAETTTLARETVLAAGTIGSPHLLQLSGIGEPEALARAGIVCRHALSGVGAGFRDHLAARLRWRVRLPAGVRALTFNERTRGVSFLREIARYMLVRRGVLASPIATCVGFARSDPREPVPDLQFHFAPASYPVSAAPTRRLDPLPGMTIGVYPMRPEAEGRVHAVSSDPLAPPAIETAFLAPEADRRRLIAGMRIARRIVAQPAFDPVRGEELVPGSAHEDDAALLDHLRAGADTSYHPVGTCRMGTGADAVVDPALRVLGLEGLRVADASIMPTHVSGNTQAATMMIAEKAAALLRAGERGAGDRETVQELRVCPGDPRARDVAALLSASEEHAHALYPADGVHLLDRAELTRSGVAFLVVRRGAGKALGCAALVEEDDGHGEIKRMFVAPSARRTGVARALIAALESEARRRELHVLRLETGPAQPEALALYRAAGFRDRGPFGSYRAHPASLFLEKRLAHPDTTHPLVPHHGARIMSDRFDHDANLARAGSWRAHRSPFWPPAEGYRLACLDIGAAGPDLGGEAAALFERLRALIEAEWQAEKAVRPDTRTAFHAPGPIADTLAALADLLPREEDRLAARLRAAAIRDGYTDETLEKLAAIDEEVTLVAGRISTWYGKETGGLATAFACRRDAGLLATVEAACDRLGDVAARLRDLHAHLRLGALPAFVPADLFFMAGEGNRHPKHVAYFLPEDEGVKHSPFKKTCYFANTHRGLVGALGLPLAREILDLGRPLPVDVAGFGVLPALGVHAHEAGHFVHREGVGFKALNAADRWASVTLQEVAADTFALVALADVLAPAAGHPAEEAVAYHLAECLRYVDRGLGLFPDGDGMYLQLSYLVSLGALELVPGGEGTPPRLCGDPEVVLAGFRSLARVLADTLLAGDVERSLALYRDFGPAGQARHLAPLVAHLSTRPGASLEYLQEPAGAVSSAVALAS